MIWKIAVIAAVAIVWLYELYLSLLSLRSKNNAIPPCVADVYDEETHRIRLLYHREKNRLSMLRATASFAVEIVLLACNAYAAFAGLFSENQWVQMFAVLLLSAVASLVTIPFQYYDTMRIEQAFGFNRTTVKTFVFDRIKEFILQFALMIGLGSMLFGLHRSFGDWLILVFAAFATLFMLFITFLYPFFSRIFNKFKPLEDGELREKLTALLEKNGYRVRAINVMDASRRSTKANAYFAGFGKMKTIVLYDTLVESMTPDEIVAVFAHELGHGLHKDTLKNQLLTFFEMLILGFLAWGTLKILPLFTAFGFQDINYGFALIVIMSAEFALLAPLFGLLANWFSRRAEYRADAHAVKEGYGEALISALKKLARQNYSDPAPSPVLVALTYSHPTLAQRIDAIRVPEARK
ncbi:MAG: M48 family metallopeptidase [Clostridia bacterium]|nr:M48 family metallopeptidase [Clostridia bacterium]